MTAGVSTACLYPKPLEESLYDLAVNGIPCVEIFINTFRTEKGLRSRMCEPAETLRREMSVRPPFYLRDRAADVLLGI